MSAAAPAGLPRNSGAGSRAASKAAGLPEPLISADYAETFEPGGEPRGKVLIEGSI